MARNRSQAVVVGASMAGLLAARALSDHFERVTIIERDVLPSEPSSRKGVPQGNHAHGLLASGFRVLDEFFPGMMDDLHSAGAPRGDVVGDFLWFQYGGWKLRHESGLGGIAVSRPALETAIQKRVRALPNVELQEGWRTERPAFDAGARRVTGVAVRSTSGDDEKLLVSDLLVDATGRGSRSPKWLEGWGFGRPAVHSVRVDVGYSTRIFERKPHDLRDSRMGAIIAGTPPHSTRYAAVLAAEDDRWVVTLAGMLGDYPPTDDAGWLEWARTLPTPDVYQLALANRCLTDEILTYRFLANQRHRYEQMKRFPEGYLVVGDAICSFNPIYGQGMSAAAMEAKALHECVAECDERLARRFFAAAKKVADIPWAIATGEDLRYPQVEGKRLPLTGLVNTYMNRLHRVATYDEVVCRQFFHVTNLLAPPTAVLSPRVARRVLFGRRPNETVSRADRRIPSSCRP